MSYGVNPDPYIDQQTGVLRNLLGIANSEDLEEVEADLTSSVIAILSERPVVGNFDLTHLKDIHWELFNGLYDWAGEIRTVEVAKGNTRFANSEIIEQAAKELFDKLHTQNLLKDLSDKQYIDQLAHYYSEVNVLHPFREGNGRTQRVFFGALVAEVGKRIAWERMNSEDNLNATIEAYNGDESKLREMLASLIEQI